MSKVLFGIVRLINIYKWNKTVQGWHCSVCIHFFAGGVVQVSIHISLKSIFLGLCASMACLSGAVFASTISPESAGVSFTQASGSDVLIIDAPNSHGYSINYFSSFSVDKPLDIVTAPLSLSPAHNYLSPKVVVIIADNISINSSVTLLGTATDIVFLAPQAASKIICNNCIFNNVLRGTFAAASPKVKVDDSSTQLGRLIPGVKSKISINGLYAPGVVGFDVISQEVSISGELDTNQRAIKDSRGGLTNLATGNLTVGSGGFDIVLGANQWDYESNKIVASQQPSQNTLAWVNSQPIQTLGGTINSIYTKISSTGNLVVNTKINSVVDYPAVVSYQQMTHTPEEVIALQTLGYGNLTVKSKFNSRGKVALRSVNNAYVKGALIKANDIELLSAGLLKNSASVLDATNIKGSAKRIHNEGTLKALGSVELWAEQDLANQYGGAITAGVVMLESENQVVRNGSRTPYRSTDLETNGFLALSAGNFLDSSNLHLQSIGTYYALNSKVAKNKNGGSMAANNSAHITANEVHISARAIENINPYFQMVDDQQQIEMSRALSNQISISAEKYLFLSTPVTGYVVNSSAIMSVTSSNGELNANAGLFLNDRYRVLTLLKHYQGEDTLIGSYWDYDEYDEEDKAFVEVTENTKTYISETLAYSPPGRLRTMSNTRIETGESGAIVNSLSYMELFEKANFETPSFLEYGLKNQGIAKTSRTKTDVHTLISSQLLGYRGSYLQDPKDLDSLFYVKKDIFSLSTLGLFITVNAFDYFIDEVIATSITEDQDNKDLSKLRFHYPLADDEYYHGEDRDYSWQVKSTPGSSAAELAKDTGVIAVKWKYNQTTYIEDSYELYEEHGSKEGVTRYSLWEVVKDYYETVKNTIVEFFTEWNWWGE